MSSDQSLVQQGAREQLLEDFRAVKEATSLDGSLRYAESPTMTWLAKFIAGSAGGPNKDMPLLELCHLINGVAAAGSSPDWMMTFFMTPEKAIPETFQNLLNHNLDAEGWQRDGFEISGDGLTIHYPEGAFTIRYGRMPRLVALFEFLSSLESFAFYADFQMMIEQMTVAPFGQQPVKDVSNKISSYLRQYRRRHLPAARYDGKFNHLLSFFAERGEKKSIDITDAAILDFWCLHNKDKEFKGYRTVFDLFINFMNSMDEARLRDATENAAPIGLDRDGGEVEPEAFLDQQGEIADWQSPFDILDQDLVSEIKFFKKKGERQPIENLMRFGPRAVALPLASLRYDIFGQVQAGITNDLQVGRGTASIKERLTCEGVDDYDTRHREVEKILAHVRQLQQAAWHVISNASTVRNAGNDNVVAFPGREETSAGSLFQQALADDFEDPDFDGSEMADASAKALKKLTRKGFEEDAHLDGDRVEAFNLAAGALIEIARQLENYLARLDQLNNTEPALAGWFDTDKTLFSQEFTSLYGDQS